MASFTIRLDDELGRALTKLTRAQHRSKSDLVREMLRWQLALMAYREARSLPEAAWSRLATSFPVLHSMPPHPIEVKRHQE